MIKKCLVLSIVWIILLSLTSIRAPLAQKYKGPAANDPDKNIQPREETVIARTSVILLRHIAQARAKIRVNAPDSARHELNQAERLLRTIRDDFSSAVTKDRISIALKHLQYNQSQKVLEDISPIYASLDGIEDYIPTDKTRQHINRAMEYLEKKDHNMAARELEQADKSLVTMDVELPILETEKFIIKAEEYLDDKNADKADGELIEAERKAHAIAADLESPFRQAKKKPC